MIDNPWETPKTLATSASHLNATIDEALHVMPRVGLARTQSALETLTAEIQQDEFGHVGRYRPLQRLLRRINREVIDLTFQVRMHVFQTQNSQRYGLKDVIAADTENLLIDIQSCSLLLTRLYDEIKQENNIENSETMRRNFI